MLPLRRFLALFGVTLTLAGAILVSSSALAQGFTPKDTGVTEAAGKAGYQTDLACSETPGGCIPAYAGAVINALAGLFGAFFFGLMLYGGFLYMTAGGESAKTQKARQTIANAIIGVLIVASSYAIATFVLNALGTVTTGVGEV